MSVSELILKFCYWFIKFFMVLDLTIYLIFFYSANSFKKKKNSLSARGLRSVILFRTQSFSDLALKPSKNTDNVSVYVSTIFIFSLVLHFIQ